MGGKNERRRQPVEAQWTDPEAFKRFDVIRDHVRPATAAVVDSILTRFVPPSGRIVEVGSGMGELRHRLLAGSPYAAVLEQTEQSAEVVAAHNRLHPDTPMQQANVYDLHTAYDDATVDAIIGFSSFDTFIDMPRAVAAMDRVLKPGGKLIHFLDINASTGPFFHDFARRKDKRVMIHNEDEDGRPAVILVPSNDYVAEIAAMRRRRTHSADKMRWLERYPQNAEAELRDPSRPEFLGELRWIGRRIARTVPGVEMFSFKDYFTQRLDDALTNQGYLPHVFGQQEATVLVDDPNAQAETESNPLNGDLMAQVMSQLTEQLGVPVFDLNARRVNSAVNDMGSLEWFKDPSVPPGKQKITSKLHVVVAEKPAA